MPDNLDGATILWRGRPLAPKRRMPVVLWDVPQGQQVYAVVLDGIARGRR